MKRSPYVYWGRDEEIHSLVTDTPDTFTRHAVNMTRVGGTHVLAPGVQDMIPDHPDRGARA